MDLNQCLKRQLLNITLSDDVINATTLEMVHDIATSMRLIQWMAELYNKVEVSNAHEII